MTNFSYKILALILTSIPNVLNNYIRKEPIMIYIYIFLNNRIINTWNNLHDKVMCVESTEKLKINLDKHFSTIMFITNIDLNLKGVHKEF